MLAGYSGTSLQSPVILSEAKDPLHSGAITGSARNFYRGPAFLPLNTGHCSVTTDH
jgi:hypothetical protein